MIAEKFNYVNNSSGIVARGVMDIGDTGKPYIYELLRKGVYSDPVGSVIREIACNAHDSHVEKGIPNRPIEITVPSINNPNFIVRDFGVGLSVEKAFKVYSQYGESTKRNNNDTVGQLGIGAKSPLAIVDSFTVISRQNGDKHIFNLVINSDGCGEIIHMGSYKTGEEDGLEVTVSVPSNYLSEFPDKINRFFKFWNVKPILHNTDLSIGEIKYLRKAENCGLTAEGMDSVVLMGTVAYKLDVNQINGLSPNERSYFRKNYIFFVKIGDVNFTGSREQLRYTEKTIQKIKSIIKEESDFLRNEFQKSIDNCANLRLAKVKWEIINKHTLFIGSLDYKFTYKGIEIKDSLYPVSSEYAVRKANRKGDLVYDLGGISACNERILYYTIKPNNLKRLIRHFGQTTEPILVKSANEKPFILEEFIKKNELQDFQFIDLTNFKIPRVKHSYTSFPRYRNPDEKHRRKIFKFNNSCGSSSLNYKTNWDIVKDLDLEAGGVYVVLDRFEISPFSELESICLRNYIREGKSLYGVKTSFVNNLNSKWIKFNNYCENLIKESESTVNSSEIQKALIFKKLEKLGSALEYAKKRESVKYIKRVLDIIQHCTVDNIAFLRAYELINSSGKYKLTKENEERHSKAIRKLNVVNILLDDYSFKNRIRKEEREMAINEILS